MNIYDRVCFRDICHTAAIRLRPSHAPSWRALAMVLLELNDRSAAIACMREVVRLSPTDTDAALQLKEQVSGRRTSFSAVTTS